MIQGDKKALTSSIKERAYSLGFDICGIAGSRPLREYEAFLRDWCGRGMNDRMQYLCRDISKRSDPGSLLPEARSVIVAGLNYYTARLQKHDNVPVISRYAFGKDYHKVITGKLNILLDYIRTLLPGTEGKSFSDSAPVMEKPWAVQAGLGWQGKHSIMIHHEKGSFFLLGILILTAELEYDPPCTEEKCGECRICIDECPTGAINEDRTIDARKCIANLTIENRDPLKQELIPLLGKRIYGCDRCQEVCPWNRFAVQHNHPELEITPRLAEMTREDWVGMDEKRFNELFTGTSVGRVKFERFRTNMDMILNSPDIQ